MASIGRDFLKGFLSPAERRHKVPLKSWSYHPSLFRLCAINGQILRRNFENFVPKVVPGRKLCSQHLTEELRVLVQHGNELNVLAVFNDRLSNIN